MPRHYSTPETQEWSFLIEVEKIEAAPRSFSFEASGDERANLARRLGLVSVEKAEADVTLQRAPGGTIHAIGTVRADITQSCVVSLVPVPSQIEEEFEGWFGDKTAAVSFAKARSEREAKKGHVEAEILEESVDPEPITGGKVDIGELATQYLSLGIEPYPHAPGVTSEFLASPEADKGESGGAMRKNPFEALKDWKEKR